MARRLLAALVGLMAVAGYGCGGADAEPRSPTATHPAATHAAPPPPAQSTPPGTAAAAQDWPTYHRDGTRSGTVRSGPGLGRVRHLWSAPVDGAAYAEPLVVGGKAVVATEHDVVQAFDAVTGRAAWTARLGTPVDGGSLPCGNIDPSGITGTPVADPASHTLYVVAFLRGPRHELFAIDLTTGAVRWSRPVDPPGADPSVHQQRAALALSRGRVYVAYGGLYGDCGPYNGWVVGAPASGPGGPLVAYRVPTRREGGIWTPAGPAVDGAGRVYVSTGNGSSSSFDYGNAVIRLTPDLHQDGFFAPGNAGALSGPDLDLGSTGPLLLPGSRAFIAGKTGDGYLINTRRLGGLGHPVASLQVCGAAFGGAAYAAGVVYMPCTDGLVAVRIGRDRPSVAWRQGGAGLSPIVAGPGVWSIGGSTLHQLDPRSGRVRFSASIGEPAHFATPAASGGRIYVAAGGRLQAFGPR